MVTSTGIDVFIKRQRLCTIIISNKLVTNPTLVLCDSNEAQKEQEQVDDIEIKTNSRKDVLFRRQSLNDHLRVKHNVCRKDDDAERAVDNVEHFVLEEDLEDADEDEGEKGGEKAVK